MRRYGFRLTLLAALVLTGCASPAMDRVGAAESLAEQGRLEEADAVYDSMMRSEITEGEFERLEDLRCDVRDQMAQKMVDALDPPNTTFEEIEEIRDFVSRCDSVGDFEAELANAGIARAMKRYREEVTPLLDSGDIPGAIRAAQPILGFLPSEHPRYIAVEQAREQELERLHTERERHAGYPDAAALFDAVIASYEGTPERPRSSRVDELWVRQGGPINFDVDTSCTDVTTSISSLLPAEVTEEEKEVAPFQARATLVSCRANRSIQNVTETYYETIEVIEEVPRVVKVKTQKSKTTITENRRCYTSKNGFGSGCVTESTDRDTSTWTEVNREVVMVKERVQKQVPRERPALQAVDSLSALVVIEVAIAGKTSKFTVPVSTSNAGPYLPAGTPPEMISGPDPRRLRGSLISEAKNAVASNARSAAQRMQTDKKLVEWSKEVASGDERVARNAAALMWLAGETIADTPLDEVYGYDLFASAGFEPVGPLPAGLSENVYVRGFNSYMRNIDDDTVFARGYPISFVTLSAHQLDPADDLVAQPDRQAFGVHSQLGGRLDVLEPLYLDGLSLMFGYDFGFGIGYRPGENYEAPDPLNTDDVPSDGRVTTAFEAALPLLFGLRSDATALLVGLRLDWRNFAIGHYWSQGTVIAPTGRLEFRLHPRFPFILEAWGFNLLGNENDFTGGTLSIPVLYENWIQLHAEAVRLRTRIYGLNENDPVQVDDALTYDFRVGWLYKF